MLYYTLIVLLDHPYQTDIERLFLYAVNLVKTDPAVSADPAAVF